MFALSGCKWIKLFSSKTVNVDERESIAASQPQTVSTVQSITSYPPVRFPHSSLLCSSPHFLLHSCASLLPHSLTRSLTNHSLPHYLIYSLPHSLTHLLAHSLTHSPTHWYHHTSKWVSRKYISFKSKITPAIFRGYSLAHSEACSP